MLEISDTNSGQMILSFVQRLERLEEEISGINSDKKDIYAELKGNGFDPKVIKRLLSYRRKDKKVAEEEDAIFDLYLHAIETASQAPSRTRTRDEPTMTISYTDKDGEKITTPPVTLDKLAEIERKVKMDVAKAVFVPKKHLGKNKPPAAEISDDPFAGG